MPYIIGTKQPGPIKRDGSPLLVASGRPTAVATLNEAREHLTNLLEDDFQAPLPESGGTVGPLPDGTVIEVRQMLRDDVTASASEDRYIAGMTADEMVAAFNAA